MSAMDIGRSEFASSSRIRFGMRQSDFCTTASLGGSIGMLSDHFIRAIIAFAIAL